MSDLNELCRDFSIDKHPKQLQQIIQLLRNKELWDVAVLLQSLLKSVAPTLTGATLLHSVGFKAQQMGYIPYHMKCLVDSSDTFNNFIIDNEGITRDDHKSCNLELSTLYTILCQGTNYWDSSKVVVAKQTQRIVVTMTTCRRLQLFIQTVQSFLVCCKDLNTIDAWYTIDDNSSLEDRHTMEEMFPWMIFIWKTPQEKGHAKSMNILRESMPETVEYIVHLEDDWRYMTRQNYVTKGVAILDSFPDVGQILFNIHYVESPSDYIDNGVLRGKGITTHLLHEYEPVPELNSFSKYWPHFSLRPGVVRKCIWDTIPFDESSRHFEMTYAHEYISHGWKTAFFNTVTCIHTGRPVNTNIGVNAYELNGQIQFKDSTISPLKFVQVSSFELKSIFRVLKRSERLKPKNWFFGLDSNLSSKVAFIICKNLYSVEWDTFLIKNGANKTLKLTNSLEIDDDTKAVVVKHDSIRKILEEQVLRVYICYI